MKWYGNGWFATSNGFHHSTITTVENHQIGSGYQKLSGNPVKKSDITPEFIAELTELISGTSTVTLFYQDKTTIHTGNIEIISEKNKSSLLGYVNISTLLFLLVLL